MSNAEIMNWRACLSKLVEIRWHDPNRDWPYFVVLIVDGPMRMVALRGADYPDGSAKHDGDEFWADMDDVALFRCVTQQELSAVPMLTIDEAAECSKLAKKQLTDLRRENDHMRASLANGPGPCAYCDLPRDQWGQCSSGMPGCARSDDAMLCPHVGAGMNEERLNKALEHIANGEIGLDLCVKLAKEALC